MGWGIGFDYRWNRDIGYGVPAICDYPGCTTKIDRGLAYVCCGQEPYGGDGCGLYFCEKHQDAGGRCERCAIGAEEPFEPKPDCTEWIEWKLSDESWAAWREANPDKVVELQARLEVTRPVSTGKTNRSMAVTPDE